MEWGTCDYCSGFIVVCLLTCVVLHVPFYHPIPFFFHLDNCPVEQVGYLRMCGFYIEPNGFVLVQRSIQKSTEQHGGLDYGRNARYDSSTIPLSAALINQLISGLL